MAFGGFFVFGISMVRLCVYKSGSQYMTWLSNNNPVLDCVHRYYVCDAYKSEHKFKKRAIPVCVCADLAAKTSGHHELAIVNLNHVEQVDCKIMSHTHTHKPETTVICIFKHEPTGTIRKRCDGMHFRWPYNVINRLSM